MEYGIREHALLWGLLVKNSCEILGDAEGRKILGEAVYAYGHGRGKRMAETAESLGLKNDMTAFFLCGEWKGKEGENISESILKEKESGSVVHRCRWYDTWIEEGLQEYGPLYCAYVDQGICDGFDVGVGLTIEQSKGRGDETCRFCWSAPCDSQRLAELRSVYKDSLIKPFSFHCQDLLKAVREALQKQAPARAEQILQQTKTDFMQRTAPESAELFS